MDSPGVAAWGLWQVPQSNCMGAPSANRAGWTPSLRWQRRQSRRVGRSPGSGERKSWQTKQ